MFVKMNSEGQITLPESLLSAMKLKVGDSVMITQHKDGIMLRAVTETLYDLRGSVPVDDVQDFNAVIEEAKQQMAMELADTSIPQPARGDIFDLLGSIPVNELQDFDKIREVARKHVAKKVMRDLHEGSSSRKVD